MVLRQNKQKHDARHMAVTAILRATLPALPTMAFAVGIMVRRRKEAAP